MKTIGVSLLATLLPISIAVAGGNPLSYKVNGVSYEGYYVAAGEKAPLVLIVHDWDGLNDYEIKRAEMLANLGYSVFAADLFGAGVRPSSLEERQKLTGALYKDREKMQSILYGALSAAQSKGADIKNAVAVGYCFGGAAVLELARSGADLKGFVTFHGGLATPEGQDYSAVKGKVLVLHGTADTSVTMEDFAKLAVAMESKGVNHEMITYSGAPHAFTVFGTDRYREDADKKSWQRFTSFLTETLDKTGKN
jgi:dienelactone hydrolase